jgi:hypothetical protein
MKSVALALVLAACTLGGCSLGPYARERDVVHAAASPCFSGDICAISFEGPEIRWATDILHTVR